MKNRFSTRPAILARFLALGALLGAAPALLAQPASLVKDIATTGVQPLPFFFFPSPIVELDGIAYFFDDDGVHGQELWRSDGTDAGTGMVKDVCPGECSSELASELVIHSGSLYFVADDGVHGRELWRSDGTDPGTRLVADALPGPYGSRPEWLTSLGDLLLFTAGDLDHGRELWASDGTAGGTEMVKDIRADGSSEPASFAAWNGVAWFVADDGVHGEELWTSDGSAGGTHLVRDIHPGADGGVYPDQSPRGHFRAPEPLGGYLLFPADDGVHGEELWRSDGTEAGTTLLADIHGGSSGSSPFDLTVYAGEVYFQADQSGIGQELWKTDGTTGGTVLVRDIDPGFSGSNPQSFTAAGGKLFFAAGTSAAGEELWTTDGTGAGTTMVADVRPGPDSGLYAFPGGGLEAFGDRVLFEGDDGTHSLEPWVSDGTEAGTHLVRDLNPGAAWAFDYFQRPLVSLTLAARALFFAATDASGWRLWATDGTEAGSELVQGIEPQHSSIPRLYAFELTYTADVAATFFFQATDHVHGEELWASDGTSANTRMVKDIDATPLHGSYPQELTALGGKLLFAARPPSGDDYQLWISDGSEAGTVPIASTTSTGPVDPRTLTRFGDAVYFSAFDASDHPSLWRSDGTDAGTQPFPYGAPLPYGNELAPFGNRLFVALAAALWTTRGDAASTEKLADVEADDLTPSASLLFFAGTDSATGTELWVSDGTAGGTHRVLDLLPGVAGSIDPYPAFLTVPRPDKPPIAALATRNLAFFAADDGLHGRELWASDGTPGGTHLVLDVRPGAAGSEPRYLTVVGEHVFFTSDDGVHGAELWVSDGTAGGTFMVLDVEDGAASSVPASLARVWGELVFSAWRSDVGRELWRSDGTPGGTSLIQDVNPGAGSSSPEHLTLSGGRLFFTANDGTTGFELWALPVAAPALSVTKELGGAPIEGRTVTYALRLTNPGTFASADDPGDELVDVLPAGLELLAASADAGTVEADPASRTVRWNGSVPAGGTVTVTVEARIEPGTVGETLVNQATAAFDEDGDGTSEGTALSDDPATGPAGDPTALVVLPASVVEVPALSPGGLALLGLLLAAAGGLALRR